VAGLVRVRTLGTIDVGRVHGPEAGARAVVSQPKRFALLAYLAAATPHGFHRRDKLLGLFWPDLDLDQGRHALRQSLHFLRLRLGPVVVRRGDEDVGLDPAILWCDAPAFEQALGQNQPAAALELYGGDFLPGFYVSGVAAEFGQWLESERARLRACAARAAWAVANQTEVEGRAADAAHWARRAVALAPDDEGGVRRLMAMLDRIGDRSGALRAYEQFAEGLRTEFAADPAPETQVLLAAVRQGRSAPPGPSGPGATAVSPAAVSPVPVPSVADPDFDQLVGRDHVLQLLRTELRRALAGSCEPVLVLGEAGIGKTQLARHFARAARAEGARCLVAHFFDYQGSRLAPYEILLDVLASALEGEPNHTISLAERVRGRLGVTLPPELGHPGEGGPVRPAPADPGQVSAALGRCFRRLSRERPLVLLLDDLQWADEASRQVVGYLMRTAVADPMLIVGLARLEEAEEQSHPLAAWLRQEAAARGFTSVRLRALTEAEVGTEVARVFAGCGGVALPAGVPATLHRLTGGNPYFLVETLRFLLEHGLLCRATGADPVGWTWHDPEGLFADGAGEGRSARNTAERLVLPASLAAAAGARLDRLSAEVRALVETAAVIGEEFRLRTLAAVEGRDEAALEPLLAAASRAGVISESGVSPGEDARFAHTLLRRACYAAVPARRRRRLHERVAQSLEAVYRDDLDRVAPAIAAHLAAAAQPGMALLWFLRASRAAAARGQWREAWEAIERARAVADEAARAGVEVDPGALPALRLAEGEALLAAGRLRESAAALGDAARLARAGAPAGEVGAGTEGRSLEALALLRLARARASLGEYAEARASAEAAHGRFRAMGDEAAAAAALVQLGEVDTALGEYTRAVRPLEQALAALDTPAGDPRLVGGAAAALGWALGLAGEAERALAFLERAHELYAAAGDQRQDAHVLRRTQWIHLCRGRYELAVRLAEAAREAFQSVGDAFGEAKAELAIGQARVAQGLYEEGGEYLRRTRDATRKLGDSHCEAEALWLLARVEVETGRHAEGAVLLENAIDVVRGVGDRDDEFRMLIDLAAARSGGGDHAGALRIADEAMAIARALGSAEGEGAASAARTWALLGLGRRSEAVEAGRQAVTLLEEARSGERWRGHWALGAALAATAEGEAACDALRRAVALLAAIRDDLPAGDAARRAAVTRARAEPAGALVRQLRALGRDVEADELARQWAQPPINPPLADA
jgi:DNA-binding SARP family transcriptional activator/tetratricopeptide (TPR) repeat protein